ncbi:DUF1517 domain-containing protein [bacterium]|nr:DUF1517 domain-containing protein [bacterium]
MRTFLFLVAILFSITLFGQRSGGRIGGSAFETDSSSSSYSSSSSSGSSYSGSTSSSSGSSSSKSSIGGFSSQNSSDSSFFNSSSSYDKEPSRESTILVSIILLIFLIIFILIVANRKYEFININLSYIFSDLLFYCTPQKRKYTSLKIQFGFHATIYNLRKEFIEIAEKLDFSKKESLRQLIINFANLTDENYSYIKYADFESVTNTTSSYIGKFNHQCYISHESEKISEETYLKIQNHKSVVKELKEENKPQFMEIKEYIIFTLIVTCKNLKIKNIDNDYSYQYYSSILQQLKQSKISDIQAVDVIWTPDAENDVLTEDDVISNYSNLKLV